MENKRSTEKYNLGKHSAAKYIVAIGNPGQQHARQYHNLGLIFANWLIEKFPNQLIKKQKEYELFKFAAQNNENGVIYGEFFLIKSLVFMNNSFEAVREIYNLYKLSANNFLVMHDELMIPKYQIKLKYAPGNAGHNGLRNLSEHMKNDEGTFARLRIGIDHPKNFKPSLAVYDYVLSNIDNLDEYRLAFETHGIQLIMQWLNTSDNQ